MSDTDGQGSVKGACPSQDAPPTNDSASHHTPPTDNDLPHPPTKSNKPQKPNICLDTSGTGAVATQIQIHDTVKDVQAPNGGTTEPGGTSAAGVGGESGRGKETKGATTKSGSHVTPTDLEILAKMEEANRQIAISPSSVITTNPTELELIAKLEEANRLLEADKVKRKGLTPTHSRAGSTAGPVGSGHSRKGSSTSQISVNSSNSQVVDEDTNHSNLWHIWGKLVNDWASAKKKPSFIKQLVRKGIPHPFRGLAWQLLLDVNNSPMKDMYVEYLKQTSPSEKMIRRDIARTFPEHDFFKEKDGLGQESLFNVMKAYSLHDREVGYCQGSGFIVGILLMVQMPEEEAFAVLVKLMQDYGLRELFTPSMAELGLCMFKLECLIQELLPDLYTHFQTQSFHTSMYASSWFLTLFATVVPLSIACRVMDLFISEGMDAIFRLGIAILQSSQHELLSQDMESMLQFFQKEVSLKFERDEDILFTMAHQVRYSAKKLKRLEKEYITLKSKENEEQIELRRLRTENRLLRQRIENLEKESATLADRLIQYQLTRAQEAEETYALKNELSLTKQKYVTAQKQLKEAESLIGDIKERTDSIHSASSLDEGEAHIMVQGLQEELITVRLREAENFTVVKNLRNKVHELQQDNTRLQQAPSNDVQCLQEELIAVKLREAEANLSLKEMRQSISDLEVNWQRHLSSSDSVSSPKEKSNSKSELKGELKKSQEELMTSKLKEAGALSHLKDAKQKIMELETSNQICTNQIRRMDEECKKLKTEIDDQQKAGDGSQKQIKSLLRKIDDLESKHREELMMGRIREAETDQVIGELKQKIAHMEIQKEELIATDSLEAKEGKQDLHNTIFDLQEEVMQLKMSVSPNPKSPNVSASSAASSRTSNKLDDDYFLNEDEDEDIEDPESLNRTLSEIIEGKRSSTSLIAILNRENSDCDTNSVKSTSSENSGSGLRLSKSNSFKGVKPEERDGETIAQHAEDIRKRLSESNNVDCDNASSTANQVLNSAINQSGSYVANVGTQSSKQQTGSVTAVESKHKNSAMQGIQSKDSGNESTQSRLGGTGSMSVKETQQLHSAMQGDQSGNDVQDKSNGDATSHVDANENISSKGAKQNPLAESVTEGQISAS